MKYFEYNYLIILYIFLTSCSNSELNEDYFNLNFKALAELYEPLDTIPLSDSIYYFNYDINIDRISENKITAAQFPNLSIYMLDSLGEVREKITQSGSALGMLGLTNFAMTSIDDTGNIYVLTSGFTYRVFVFNSNNEFIKVFNLFDYISESLVFPVNSSFMVIENGNEHVRLVISVDSNVHSRFSDKLFSEAESLVYFTIDKNTWEIIDYDSRLPFKNLSEIQDALQVRKVHWSENQPLFDFSDNKYFVAYPFSKYVRVYDNNFIKLDSIEFNTLSKIPLVNFESEMKKIDDAYKRNIVALRLARENLKIQYIDVIDNFILIQFSEISKKDNYSLPTIEEFGSPRDTSPAFLHAIVKNLTTGEEKFITLPPNFYKIYIKNWNTFYGYYSSKKEELML